MINNIYFICPDTNEPMGGVLKIYTQVDILNEHGYSAYVFHENNNFRCDWFPNSTKIYREKGLQLSDHDCLVVPGNFGPQIDTLAPGCKKIIFNQGAYRTFAGYPLTPNPKTFPYNSQDILGFITVSEDSGEYLNFCFPSSSIWIIKNSVNREIFFYGENKKKQIAFMPRKGQEELIQIINIFKYRKLFPEYEFIPIANKKPAEVASILRESLIFCSVAKLEGFGLPPAEAMACGCIVVGFNGNGGKEYFQPDFCYSVENDNIIAIVKALEAAIQEYENQPNISLEKRKKASAYILSKYSLEEERKSILDAWSNINHSFF